MKIQVRENEKDIDDNLSTQYRSTNKHKNQNVGK